MKNNIFFDGVRRFMPSFPLYVGRLDVKIKSDIRNTQWLTVCDWKRIPVSVHARVTCQIIHEKQYIFRLSETFHAQFSALSGPHGCKNKFRHQKHSVTYSAWLESDSRVSTRTGYVPNNSWKTIYFSMEWGVLCPVFRATWAAWR